MRVAVAFALAVAWVGAVEAYDVLHFRDRRDPVRGVILEETKRAVEFRIIHEGRKGEVAGSVDATFQLADIARIERITPVERGRVIARSEALSQRGMRLHSALQKISVSEARLLGSPALLTRTKHFEIYSTCDERFLREVTHYSEEMFRAFRANFPAREDAAARIKIYLFASREEYNRFQRIKIGAVLKNPAFYNNRENYIAVCNLVHKKLADQIRERILAAERVVREHKEKIRRAKQSISREVAKAYRRINKAYAAHARTIPKGDQAAWRRLKQWRSEQVRAVTHRKRELHEELDAMKKEANRFISTNRKVIVHNNGILARENKQMFETMFHEGFHAFAYNYLWVDGHRCVVPRWLDEGFACYYQESVVEAGYLIHGGVNESSLALLRKAKREGKLVPLEKIVTGTPRDFLVAANASGEHSGIYYSQSWALVHYMLQQVSVEQVQLYLKRINSGADKRKAFEKMMGRTIPQVDAAVTMHVAKLLK